jgi:hypothetical protein
LANLLATDAPVPGPTPAITAIAEDVGAMVEEKLRRLCGWMDGFLLVFRCWLIDLIRNAALIEFLVIITNVEWWKLLEMMQ